MNMKIIAKSPISHGAFTDGADTGNIMEFRRIPVIHNGKIVEVPAISGNAVRGILRRILAREFFELLNLRENLNEEQQDKLYAILGNGGALGKNVDAEVNVNFIREVRKNIPLLSVFGAGCYNYILQGMFSVGFFKLDCAEIGTGEMRIQELTAEIGEAHHIDKTTYDTKKAEMKPMPYTTEVVVEGATFSGGIEFYPQTTEAEIAAVYHGIRLIKTVGGKVARGYGNVEIISSEVLADDEYINAVKNTDIDFIKKFIGGLS